MTVTEAPKDVFRIAFALSGAVSAGAYTAGVLDYFFQALDAWEREREEPGVPGHRVAVQVITGASAGAITGALGAVALAHGIRPQELSDAERGRVYLATAGGSSQKIRCVLPSLYETWVVRPKMVDPAGGTDFLSAEDLTDPKSQVVSVLNSRLLEDIRDDALRGPSDAPAPAAEYPYLAQSLHVYMTVSNLRGIPFEVSFGNATYGMQAHGDRVHYIIEGIGTAPSADNVWLANDSARTLAAGTLPKFNEEPSADWSRYGTCALASSAFPVGLAPRQISASLKEYTQRSYPVQHGNAKIEPAFPKAWASKPELDAYTFLNVDGGVINNDPFDYAEYALMGAPRHAAAEPEVADCAVVMISPFPEPPTFLADGLPRDEVIAVLKALYPALIDQVRFKATELFPAMDPEDYSRFLISPERSIGDVEQRFTIACGLLGGFGGFLDEKFRAHDFQLGRRNCQAFLRSTFGIAVNNKILGDPAPAGAATFRLVGEDTKSPIIPRLGDAVPEVGLPPWPQMSAADLDTLIGRAKGRLDKLTPRFVQAQTSSRFYRALGRFGLWVGQGRILDFVRFEILGDLVRRNQIEGWGLPDALEKFGDDVREILAQLVNPAFTFRTPDGIAKSTHIPLDVVDRALTALVRADKAAPFRVWQGSADGKIVYTLWSRKPGWFASLPLVRKAADWLDMPVIG
jgi:hypothetical protein